jgi:hypothetical protein
LQRRALSQEILDAAIGVCQRPVTYRLLNAAGLTGVKLLTLFGAAAMYSVSPFTGRLATVGLAIACIRVTPAAVVARATVITHVTVIDVVSGSATPNQAVTIEGNRIARVFPSDNDAFPAGVTVVDATGKYIIPGLWDMHVHAFTSPESASTVGARAVDVYLPQYLSWGVTGIRDLGGWIDTGMTVRRRVRMHEIQGPRIVAAGALIGGANRWAPPSPHAWVVTNSDSAAAKVDSLQRAGADFIKVHDFLTREVFFAVAAEARRLRLPLAGHLRPSVTLAEAVDAGQVGIEHVPIELVVACAGGGSAEANAFYDQWINGGWPAFIRATADLWNARNLTTCARALERMKRAGVRVTPTMVLRMQDSALAALVPATQLSPAAKTICSQNLQDWGSVPDSLRQRYYRVVAEIVGTIHRAGVPVLAGTDGPGGCLAAGWSLHKELENLVSAGFTPLEALRAATIEPARFLGVADSLGRVRAGMVADLVVLDANPLEDIRNTRRIAGVISDGRLSRFNTGRPYLR